MNEATELESELQTQPAIGTETLADILFTLSYDSQSVVHTERYYARGVNFWRDILPENIYFNLMGKHAGDTTTMAIPAGVVYPRHEPQRVLTIPMSRFRGRLPNGTRVDPQRGRYYPKGLLDGLTGVFPQNTEPIRCIDVQASKLTVDLNHPLAAVDTQLQIDIENVRTKGVERGGTSIDWVGNLTTGPGMQLTNGTESTDFFSQTPFERSDESPDEQFYRLPRFVNHLDDQAVELIESIYAKILRPDMRVLDLMSSWVSHIPPGLNPLELSGLGMNRSEMTANEQLGRIVVQDINRNPVLPFDSNSFDAVICTVSVEYMTRPLEVFDEVARILKTNGSFIVTFSNRWFPPKVVRIWRELHDFERMRLVLEYFRNTEEFTALETFSIRGYPRPIYDKYFPELQLSDPVYAVWGQKR